MATTLTATSLGSTGPLTSDEFAALLAALDDDRERAGERYVALRSKLTNLFRWRGFFDHEAGADRVLNTAARRLLEGEIVRNIDAYCLGIARMVLLAERREEERRQASHASASSLAAVASDTDESERRMQCLERSLAALPADHRELVLAYYVRGDANQVEARRALAARMGIELNALRIRAHRIRTRLESDVLACLTRERNVPPFPDTSR